MTDCEVRQSHWSGVCSDAGHLIKDGRVWSAIQPVVVFIWKHLLEGIDLDSSFFYIKPPWVSTIT